MVAIIIPTMKNFFSDRYMFFYALMFLYQNNIYMWFQEIKELPKFEEKDEIRELLSWSHFFQKTWENSFYHLGSDKDSESKRYIY